DLFPKSSAILFEREVGSPYARVVGGANVPRNWCVRAVTLADVPPLGEALQCPDRIIERAVRNRRHGKLPDGYEDVRMHTLWASVPDPAGSHHALMLLGRAALNEIPMREAALEITRP